MTPRRILVTNALPYANGSIHMGHLLEFTQTDIWVRFQKLRGHDVTYICGDDTHGTPVMIAANKMGIKPEELVARTQKEHHQDLIDYEIDLSHYSSTHSPENRELCEFIFKSAESQGHISSKAVSQLFCEHDKMFLPDRFVKGTCPKCGAVDQYGDSCEVCGAAYQPADMKSPHCSLCGTPPVHRESTHLLFEVEHFRAFLEEWLPKHLSKENSNKMKEWFKEPLRAWDISREAPYFGFEIPGHPGKFFYVWVDAPMGYVSGTRQWCKQTGRSFDELWNSEKSELYHFIGKDIVYFHTLFWPSLLKTAGLRTPTEVFVHGYLTLNGQKMSKSKGTQITARQYLDKFSPVYLRYYLATKLNSSNDDMDLNLDDFVQRVNSDLVGKITNLASRGATMLSKNFEGQLTGPDKEGEVLLKQAQSAGDEIAAFFEAREYSKALNEIRLLADEGNRYFDEKAPWKLLKENPAATQQVLSTTLNLFRILAIYLKPVVPSYVQKVETLFQAKAPWLWQDTQALLTSGTIRTYEHLLNRIELKAAQDLVQTPVTPIEAKPKSEAKPKAAKAPGDSMSELKPEISIDQFSAIDLRVALIKAAEAVPEADKLLRLAVDLGPLGERQIFAGIKAAYPPEKLVGRLTVVVANLKPRQMKFGLSSGMVLAAGPGAPDLFILSPDSGAKPGDPVK